MQEVSPFCYLKDTLLFTEILLKEKISALTFIYKTAYKLLFSLEEIILSNEVESSKFYKTNQFFKM